MNNNMKTIDPKQVSVAEFHGYLLGAVAPRPIALASTVDQNGRVNLSPFSFFNAFSANPPLLIFSPARRVRDNTTKHTLENVLETNEVVINIVSYAMVEQMSLASTEYEEGVNEFIKSGFTEVPSEKVTPPRVKEAPAAFECKVQQVISLGDEGGAGNLIICEVILAHISTKILDQNGKISPHLLDAVGRLGGNWYTRAGGDSLFEVEKPLRSKGIGVDQLPSAIKNSTILTGNDLGKLANVEQIPSIDSTEVDEIIKSHNLVSRDQFHFLAQQYLRNGQTEIAWKILLQENV